MDRKFKVLLVDDEDIFREATARQLRVRGFVVNAADSGEAALELVHSDPPDVVLLDQQMPGLSGSETFAAIKQANPLIEVIMLTGNTALELMKLGTFDYLMKPVNLEELLYKIEDAYARKQINERQLSAGLA